MPQIDTKRGFTLLELLIVILLLSIFTLLVVTSINIKKNSPKKTTVKSIIDLKPEHIDKWSELICINNCSECFMRDSKGKTVKIKPHFKKMQVYRVNKYGIATKVDFGRYRDKKICLRFKFFQNGSHDRAIIESNSHFYYIPTFFGKIEEFSSLKDAEDRWRSSENLLRDSGDFYR